MISLFSEVAKISQEKQNKISDTLTSYNFFFCLLNLVIHHKLYINFFRRKRNIIQKMF